MSAGDTLLLERALLAARTAILDAGSEVRDAWRNHTRLEVNAKGRFDYVTQVDKNSEKAICESLLAALPEFGLLGEEGSHINLESEYFWVVDPLDGTANFIHQYPAFALSIGLLQRTGPICKAEDGDTGVRFPEVCNTRPVLGAILDVCHDRLFWAVRGGGSWEEELPVDWGQATRHRALGELREASTRLKVTDEELGCAFLSTGFPVRHRDLCRLYVEMLGTLLPRIKGLRRGGSAALDMAYTAAGRFDGFFELHLSPWDICAGCMLLQEAGGVYQGLGSNAMADGNMIAGNQLLVRQLAEVLDPVLAGTLSSREQA